MDSVDNSAKGILFWNTLYRASPAEQYKHIRTMEQSMTAQGIGKILLCLSEATSGVDGLVELLDRNGYDTAYRPTSTLNNGLTEGLCIASRDQVDKPVAFHDLGTRRAIANTKTRWLAEVEFEGVSVLSTHASYPTPGKQERAVISQRLDQLQSEKSSGIVIGGDFNTLIAKRSFIDTVEASGVTKIGDGVSTFPLVGRFGLEIDHVFVSPDLLQASTLEVANAGPSNHRPLTLSVK